MRPFLSLCMIVKDEAAVLDRCLSSVRELVDELIVVDTGSSDDTRTIASRHQARIYEYEWTQDFAAARNYSLSKATGEWVLVLDADEYLERSDAARLKVHLASQDSSQPMGLILPVYNFVGNDASGKISQSRAMRVFSRHPDLAFARPIHEQLQSRSGRLLEAEFDVPIYHSGYTSETIERKKKTERNEAIFARIREQGHWTCYDSFVLGNEYLAQDRYAEALASYESADRPTERDKSWLPQCLANSISCLLKLHRYTDARELTRRGQERWPQACDFYWFEGYLLALLGFEEEALQALRQCMASSDSYLISPNYGTTLPLQQSAALHLRRFEIPEAVSCLTKFIYASPNHRTALLQLLRLLSGSESEETLDSFIQSLYPNPEPHQQVMILDVLVQLGIRSLRGVLPEKK